MEFLHTARRDLAAARRFFERAIDLHGEPEKGKRPASGPLIFSAISDGTQSQQRRVGAILPINLGGTILL